MAGDLAIEWRRLIEFKCTFTDPVPEERRESFEEARIEAFRGRARFVGPTAVRMGDDTLEAGR